MLLHRVTSLVCFVGLVFLASTAFADDPNYTDGTIDNPGDTIPVNSPFQISGSFTKTFYGQKSDRVLITVTKDDAGFAEYSDFNSMTANGMQPTRSVTFDSNTLPKTPINKQPIVTSAGIYTITIKAQKLLDNKMWYDLKTVMKTVTA